MCDPLSVLAVAAPIVGGLIGGDATQSAADTQSQAISQASAQQAASSAQAQQNLAPWQKTGKLALSDLEAFLGLGSPTGVTGTGTAPGIAPFTDTTFQNDPGFKAMLAQGSDAILNNRSALGGVNSGATLKSLTDYAENETWNRYNDSFNQYYTRLNNIFSMLSGVSGTGANAAAGVAGIGANAGNALAGNTIAAGNVAGSGQIGSANALAGGFAGASNNLLLQQLFNRGGGGGGGAVAPSWSGGTGVAGGTDAGTGVTGNAAWLWPQG